MSHYVPLNNIFVDISTTFSYIGATNLALEGRGRETDPGTGASAAPARGLVTRSRAASGISAPVLRPVWEVLSLDWDRQAVGNARGDVHDLRPTWRSIRSCAPATSQEAWPGAERGGDNRLARAAVERREASALRV
jgi:hypothetical protein